MYCEKCRKHSPDNFESCAFCGAKLVTEKKKEPEKFKKKYDFKLKISVKTLLKISLVFAAVLSLCAVITAAFTASKPEKVVKALVSAIENENEEKYIALYDEYIFDYKKTTRYYADEETAKQIAKPVKESRTFYESKCGEKFKLKYKITENVPLTKEETESFNEILQQDFNYITLPKKVEILTLEITAKGDKGEYTSVYKDFYCMKIKGKWYMVDKLVYTEYISEYVNKAT